MRRFLPRSLSGAAAALLLLAALPAQAQEAPELGQLAQFIRWGGVIASVPLVLSALFLLRLVESVGDSLSTRFSNRRLTILKVQTALRFLLYIVTLAVTVGLSLRLDSAALAVIGGALAFAVGFALRDLVASFIAGITIMFDRPFQVGDRVAYGGEYGDIVKIGLRSVRMNTLDHNIITIPNNKIFTDVTSSSNYGALEMQVAMDFYIGPDQNAALAIELIREACLTSPYVYLDQPIPVLARQVILQDYVALHLKARPYVFDCQYEKPFETDVHLRVMSALREHGISAPALLHRRLDAASPVLPSASR
jgi:small-conductance mechanosensitive channel